MKNCRVILRLSFGHYTVIIRCRFVNGSTTARQWLGDSSATGGGRLCERQSRPVRDSGSTDKTAQTGEKSTGETRKR